MAPRIVVVNDSSEIVELYRDILALEGYEVEWLRPKTTVAQIVAMQPAAILLDYIYGIERKGCDLLEQLTQTSTARSVPIVLCTTMVKEVQASEARLAALGIQVILKPFEIDDLLRALTR